MFKRLTSFNLSGTHPEEPSTRPLSGTTPQQPTIYLSACNNLDNGLKLKDMRWKNEDIKGKSSCSYIA